MMCRVFGNSSIIGILDLTTNQQLWVVIFSNLIQSNSKVIHQALMCDNIGFMWSHRMGVVLRNMSGHWLNVLADLFDGLDVQIEVFHTEMRPSVHDQLADDVDSASTLVLKYGFTLLD